MSTPGYKLIQIYPNMSNINVVSLHKMTNTKIDGTR